MHLDVAIVGAGAIGLSCARRLARAGARVAVVDPRGVAGGASAGNAGLISPSHVVPLAAPGMVAMGLKHLFHPKGAFKLTPRLDPGLWSWMARFAWHCSEANVRRGVPVLNALLQRSRALVALEAKELATPFAFDTKGCALMWVKPGTRDKMRHEAELAQSVGQTVQELDAAGLAALDPALAGPLGALYFPGDAHLEPKAYTQALADDLAAHGGTLIGTEVSRLLVDGGRTQGVLTGALGPVEAEHTIVAAGAWSAKLLRPHGWKLPLEAGRGFSLTLPGNPPNLRTAAILMEPRVALTPMAGRLRLGGTMELAGLRETLVPARLAALTEAWNAHMATPLGDTSQATPWTGLRPCSPDGLPYLGRLAPGLTVATGHAMLGISLAAVTGELVAQLVRGERPGMDLAPLDPLRFA
jgi:D-amino-acid dehydrogenase